MKPYSERYQLWLENPYFDQETQQELKGLEDKELEDRFYTDLEFGTGGLRGVLAAGTNRMNKYVIRKVTQGLAEYITEANEFGRQRGVVIAYDSRRFSKEFAMEAALVLAHNNIKVYLFDSLHPTPVLSFAVRHLKALAGIVITASHNPKEYNGYKVYWEDGGQVPPEQAGEILARINAREDWVIETMSAEQALASGLLQLIGEEVDKAYLAQVLKLSWQPNLIKNDGGHLQVVYTPLHGAGNLLVRRTLSELGFTHVFVVPEQEAPDPEFTTVPYPNPEIPSTFDLARKYGEKLKADILLATDPDSDRLGVIVRDLDGSYVQLSGNQIGVILEYYLLTQKKALGSLSADTTIIKTIASTDLADELAQDFNIRVENVLTGFKFIAEKEKEMEEHGNGQFLFGFEESYGYLAGNFVRDKDGVIAAMLVCEAALYYKMTQSKTLWQVLEEIFHLYGYYIEDQKSIALQGKEGKEEMKFIMDTLRSMKIREFAGLPIEKIDDYETGVGNNLSTGQTYQLLLPQSNVLRYSFVGGGFVMARPSGTEPKIKFYFSLKGTDQNDVKDKLQGVKTALLTIIDGILEQSKIK